MNNTTEIAGTDSYVAELMLIDRVPVWCRHFLTTFLAVAFLLGIPGNCLIVKVHYNLKKRSVTDWMVFYLAVSDLCSLSICAPSFIMTNVGVWNMIMPSWMCKIHFTTANMAFLSSNILIAFTALARVRKTLGKEDLISSKQACYFGIGIIIGSLCFSSIAFILTGNNVNGHCYFIPEMKKLQMYVYIIYVVIALICSVITFVSYGKIVVSLRNWRRIGPGEGNVNNAFNRNYLRSVRSSKIMGVVSFVFVISAVIPGTSLSILMGMNLQINLYLTNILIFFFSRIYFINNFANPLLYICMSSSFRRNMFSCT
ncbi:QRFP-like peptide receptor [Mya arenaria]|uniref:QRFP-like peptide receptor n=1 Tax=Mya arenaria TaxID=6604 RepID=UPI0022E17330|nr:QRFP-like peptide receptor [Mya arenaria]